MTDDNNSSNADDDSIQSINKMITINYNDDNQQQQHIDKNFVSNELIAKSFAKYYPEEANFWMYAMIVLGLAFIVFVAITIYKLCQPEKDGRTIKQQRSESMPGTTAGLTTVVT